MKHIKKYNESRDSENYYVSISNEDWESSETVNIECPKLIPILKERKLETPKTFRYHLSESTMWKKSYLEVQCILKKGGEHKHNENWLFWIEGGEDEFFYVWVQNKMHESSDYFKCDQEEGVITLLEDYGIL